MIRNLLDKQFKEEVVEMLAELSRRMDEVSENFKKEIENIKKKTNQNYKTEKLK